VIALFKSFIRQYYEIIFFAKSLKLIPEKLPELINNKFLLTQLVFKSFFVRTFASVKTWILFPPNAIVGEFYMLMITNYANCTGNVVFSQTSGTGATDCSIVYPCVIDNITVNVGACNPATGTFDITGTITYTDPPASGESQILKNIMK